jgi:hypothetical protein
MRRPYRKKRMGSCGAGRLVCLQTVGYTAAQINRLGDLVAVPTETMRSLLQQKVKLAIAKALGQSLQKLFPTETPPENQEPKEATPVTVPRPLQRTGNQER